LPLPRPEALGDISRCSKDVAMPWPQDHVDDDGDGGGDRFENTPRPLARSFSVSQAWRSLILF